MKRTLIVCVLFALLPSFASAGKGNAPFSVYEDGLMTNITPKGWIKEFLERQADGLSGHPEAMSYPFNTNLWNGPIKRMSTHGAGWWRFEQTAYYSDALIRLGYILGREEMSRKVEEGIRYTIAHAREDGRLGDDDVLNSERLFMWPQAVFFRAMKAMYDKTGDRTIPAALEKYYLAYTPEQLGSYRNVVNIEGVLWTYGITGNKALLELAKEAYDKGTFELYPALADEEGCPHLHGVTYCEELKLPAILYMWTGEERYRRIAEILEQKLVNYNMLPDGLPSSAEHVLGNSIANAHESCDISDFTWTEGYFLQMSGDGSFADRIEKAIFNALPGAITKDFKAIQYLSNINQFICTGESNGNPFKYGRPWTAYRPTHEVECCIGNIQRAMPNYVSRMWLRNPKGGLVAALYGPCEINCDGVRIEEQTRYPFDGSIRFVFHCDKAVRMPFSFRIPDWCRKVDLFVNGRKCDLKTEAGSFASLNRRFCDGDVIELLFDMPVRITHPAGQGISFERGPLLFAYSIPTRREEDTKVYPRMRGKRSENPDFKCWNMTPAGRFNYGIDDHSFKLLKNNVPEEAYPFDYPPFSIRVIGKGLPWELVEGRFTPPLPPFSVKKIPGDKADLDLVPYGCTQLRLTVFPDLGEVKNLGID